MDHGVLGNSVVDQPGGQQYVVMFPWMLVASELVSPSASSIDWSYLVYGPEGHEAWCSRIPAATDFTHPYRCWRDLHPHACCGVDLLSKSNQRSLRDSRYGEPIMPCSLMKKVPLKRYR
jgi:hypothetical protein